MATVDSLTGAPLIVRLPSLIWRETSTIVRHLRLSWRVLWALTVIESRRKYAGSILGMVWYPTYSALLLASYCFVYLVVFKMRFKELGSYEYVLFVFAGLMPFLGFSEAVSTSMTSVRQSLSILRNAVFPIEFVPVRSVFASLFGLISSMAILLVMTAPTSHFGWHVLYLPVALVELFLFCVTVAWTLSAVAVIVPDVVQIVNIVLMLMMFVSPIGYSPDMVPVSVRFLLYLNPMSYLVEAFRYAVLGMRVFPMWVDAAFLLGCAVTASISGTFFRRMSPIFSDYE